MKITVTLAAVFLGFFALLPERLQRTPDEKQAHSCDVIEDAIRASEKIKIGTTRRELAQHWVLDGGFQVRDETRYVYSHCENIRVDVKFKPVGPTDSIDKAWDDTVTGVSKPYLAYPTMD
jgi:hypothetical protein